MKINEAIKVLENELWIPISKRIPYRKGTYLVTIYDSELDNKYTTMCNFYTYGRYYNPHKPTNYYWKTETGYKVQGDVIAWRELPEPYKES